MTRLHQVPVAEYAKRAGMDLDQVLISLWDAGLDYLSGPDSAVRVRDARRVERALGLGSYRDINTVDYWTQALNVSRSQLAEYLSTLGFTLAPESRTMPKGAIAAIHRSNSATGPVEPRAIEELAPIPPRRPQPIHWLVIGKPRNVQPLDASQANAIHWALVEDFAPTEDPISPAGLRDAALLESAMARPQVSLGSTLKYPSVEMGAAAMLHSLIQNHPFHNGNKRTALVCLLVMLDENGLTLDCNQEELFRITLRTASHGLLPPGFEYDQRADREVLYLADWVKHNSRLVRKGERPLKWHELRAILRRFGCRLDMAHVGNRMNIRRDVEVRSRLSRSTRLKTLRTQTWYGGEGSEVELNSLNALRHDLQLDDEHGIDSEIFYGDSKTPLDAFIAQYRKTLSRLAKL